MIDAEPAVGGLEALKQFDPDWCLFWGKHVRSSQLAIWLPYLRRSRHRYAIMASADRIHDADRELVQALPNVMITEPFAQALDWFREVPGFRGFLYVGTQPENFRTVNRLGRKAHVYIGHGESGKGTSGFRTASLYDAILVAHYHATSRFPGAIRRWVWGGACSIGTVLVEGVHKDRWDHPRPVRTILYAPTWEGYSDPGDFTSLDVVGPHLVAMLPELTGRGTRVILRPHPATGVRRPELREICDAIYAAGAEPGADKADALGRADVLIADVSGLMAEFLFTEKPSVIPVTGRLAKRHPDASWLDHEYPWVYRWPVAGVDAPDPERAGDTPGGTALRQLLDTIETSDPLQARRAKAARQMFRGHRSLEEAARTFDVALDTAARLRWRRFGVPLRVPFELGLLRARVRGRLAGRRGPR